MAGSGCGHVFNMTADDYYNLTDITLGLDGALRLPVRLSRHPVFRRGDEPPVHAARSDLSVGRFPRPLGGQDRGDAGQALWQHPVPACALPGHGPRARARSDGDGRESGPVLRSERLITEAEDEAQRSA